MQTIQTTLRAGSDGLLHLEIPVQRRDGEYEVVVHVRPKLADSMTRSPEDLGWPPGYFDDVIGSLQETPLVREQQGEFEKRKAMQ